MIKLIFLSGALTLSAVAQAATTAELRAVELSGEDGGAKVALALTEAVPPRVFTLASPARVVIDLRHTRLRAGLRMPPGSALVTGIRTGVRPGGTLRVVLELAAPLGAHGHWSGRPAPSQQEFIIDLGDASPPAPAAAPPPQVVHALHAPQDVDRPIVVAVDAGHGGDDPGAIGHGGTREKDVTLAIARALAQRINAEPGMRAVLTRNRDEFIELKQRKARAEEAKADLFVSVHADSIRDASIAGASVYVLSDRGATDEAARWLAARENSADLKGGLLLGGNAQLDSVLIDLSQTATISASMIAAQRVLAALDSVGEVRKTRVQQAGFVVLKSRAMARSMASMLIETAYISNPQEERRLRTTAQQEKLAGAIFNGIRTFFAANPPPGTRFAQLRHALARVAPASPPLP